MAFACRSIRKRLLASLISGLTMSDSDQKHLESCVDCHTWYARQQALGEALDKIEAAEASPSLAGEIMLHIHRQEEIRRNRRPAWNGFLYSFALFLRREAWPIAFSLSVVIWGLWVNPAVNAWEKEKGVTVSELVERVPQHIDRQCREIQSRVIDGLTSILIKKEPSDSSQGGGGQSARMMMG